ncbi:hypothetical protein [Aurantiacibacter odishensis]|uniref:hypothetical protein n=1 Tax=Aurantiacibacter odishensis TaxID=1155476 RepID=UPI0013C523BF|nr:hypothetical protein [Aurantiacibacter odishensis]
MPKKPFPHFLLTGKPSRSRKVTRPTGGIRLSACLNEEIRQNAIFQKRHLGVPRHLRRKVQGPCIFRRFRYVRAFPAYSLEIRAGAGPYDRR